MARGICLIYWKEMVDTLRDRKTLIFMLLIPILAVPLLVAGLNQLFLSLQEKQALEVVRIAASQETRTLYRAQVHRWFLGTPVARGLRVATSPIVKSLIKPEHLESLTDTPRAIFTDPQAFERWIRELASKAREGIETREELTETEAIEIPAPLKSALIDFYRMAFKGLGLVEFVDPATLDSPPDDFDEGKVPEELRASPHGRKIVAAIQSKALHAYLEAPPEIERIEGKDAEPVEVTLLYDSTIRLSDEANQRVEFVVEKLREEALRKRLAELDLKGGFLEPVRMREGTNLATKSEIALSYIGGFLPYLVIMFAFLGGMYPAIDLGAGEKERNTLETLILSPSSRVEIALGKFLVILTTSLTAALMGLVSMIVSVIYLVPEALLRELDIELAPSTGFLVALLAIPPAAAFAGVFLAISIFARSFKEAQNYLTPLQFVLILPAMAPMIPGIEMNWRMALIPLVNVSLLSRDFLKGDTHWGYYGLTFAICLALAALCVAYCVRQFHREEALFRT